MFAVFRLNYSRNTVNAYQVFPWIMILFFILSKEYFSYDAEKIIVLAILFIIITIIFLYREIINIKLESKYYDSEYFWYELFLNKSAVARDFWRLMFIFVDQEDVNHSNLIFYVNNLDIFFLRRKKKYYLILFFIIKTKFLDILIKNKLIMKRLFHFINFKFYEVGMF